MTATADIAKADQLAAKAADYDAQLAAAQADFDKARAAYRRKAQTLRAKADKARIEERALRAKHQDPTGRGVAVKFEK